METQAFVTTCHCCCVQVVERLLSLPADYWSRFVMATSEQPAGDHLIIENSNCYATPERSARSPGFACHSAVAQALQFARPLTQRFIPNVVCCVLSVSMLGPLTTPEHQFSKTPSSSSLSQRMKSTLTPRYTSEIRLSPSVQPIDDLVMNRL